MTTHIFKTLHGSQKVKTILGWSTIHQCYYLTLIKQGDSDENPSFCSLIHEPELKPKTLHYFITMLQAEQVHLPDLMVHEIEAEAGSDIDHKTVEHILIGGNYYRYEIN